MSDGLNLGNIILLGAVGVGGYYAVNKIREDSVDTEDSLADANERNAKSNEREERTERRRLAQASLKQLIELMGASYSAFEAASVTANRFRGAKDFALQARQVHQKIARMSYRKSVDWARSNDKNSHDYDFWCFPNKEAGHPLRTPVDNGEDAYVSKVRAAAAEIGDQVVLPGITARELASGVVRTVTRDDDQWQGSRTFDLVADHDNVEKAAGFMGFLRRFPVRCAQYPYERVPRGVIGGHDHPISNWLNQGVINLPDYVGRADGARI